ncbi:MAG TPA: hypothetical protein VGK34_09595 [Armatimonadota bacterium]
MYSDWFSGSGDYPLSPRESGFLGYFLAVLCLVGFTLIQVILLCAHDGTSWRCANAVISRSEMNPITGRTTMYRPKIYFTYTVDGKAYDGHGHIGSYLHLRNAEEAYGDLLKNYGRDGFLCIYYDVHSPSKSEMSAVYPIMNTFVIYLIFIGMSLVPMTYACLKTELIDWSVVAMTVLGWHAGGVFAYVTGVLSAWEAWHTFAIVWVCVLLGLLVGLKRMPRSWSEPGAF